MKLKHFTFPFLYQRHSGGVYTIATYITTHPLKIDLNSLLVLRHEQISHPSPLQMMADPFVVEDNGKYYIFYEELTQKKYAKGADIAVLESVDGLKWRRMGVALREPFHLSFPNVFKWRGEWYMIPEASGSGDMRIYKAISFPMKWRVASVVMRDTVYSDPMIYIKDNLIFLWYNTYTDGEKLKLIYAHDINGPWTEHPMSPIRIDGNDSRPAGTINEIDGRLFYFVQNHQDGYGTGVIAYEILKLSSIEYQDLRLVKNPFLWKNGDGWCRDGMHQYSFCKMDEEHYLCVMDGHKNIEQSGWKFEWRNWPIFYKSQK